MTFEKRLAKIGKGTNTNIYAENSNKISVYLYGNKVIKKALEITNEKYKLESFDDLYNGVEVIKLQEELYLCRSDNSIFIVRY